MKYALILAGGTGQRMKTSGMPKQFLEVYGKPIIVYTLEAFERNEEIDKIVIPCNKGWIGYLQELVDRFNITKVKHIVEGGKTRSDSVLAGLRAVEGGFKDEDIVVIHDGVRPLVQQQTICKNIETARQYGNAMTVKANVETIVVTKTGSAVWDDFKSRNVAYTLTSPQSFRARELVSALEEANSLEDDAVMPLLDASLVYARLGKEIHLVVEDGNNIKITTPEDYYYLKAQFELQESKHILGV